MRPGAGPLPMRAAGISPSLNRRPARGVQNSIGRGLRACQNASPINQPTMKSAIRWLCLTLFTAAVSLTLQAADDETGFTPLFNGKDLAGWHLRHAQGNASWSVLPGGILKNTVE